MSDGFERVYLCHVGHEDDEYGTDKVKAALGARIVGETPAEAPGEVTLGEADVVLVLVGEHTWASAEVAATLRAALEPVGDAGHPRCGLLGLVLNSYDYPGLSQRDATGNDPMLHPTVPKGTSYWPHNVPRALFEQVQAGFAAMRPFSKAAADLEAWVHEAAVARTSEKPSRPGPIAEDVGGELGWSGPSGSPIAGGEVRVRK
ncbi:MAG: hypothetical protein KC613_05100 [Myxococcales bacterium]|nr:hypothetical protein [Myxococcales bacterium]